MAKKVLVRYQGKDDLTPTTKKVEKSINDQNEAVQGLDASMLSLDGAVGALGGTFAAAVAGIAAVAAGLWKLTTNAADAGDEMFDLSRRFGVSVESMSKLKFAADQNGASIEMVGNAMAKLSKNAANNTAAFRQWGVETENANGTLKTTEQLFLSAVNTIDNMESSVQKTSAAQDLFGTSGAKLLQVINLGVDGIQAYGDAAEEAGLVISTEAAVAANIFNNDLAKLGDVIADVARDIGAELIPAATILVRALTDTVLWVRDLHREYGDLLVVLSPVTTAMKLSVEALKALGGELGAVENLYDDVASAALDLKTQQNEAAQSTRELTEALELQEGVTKKLGDLQAKWRKEALAENDRVASEREKQLKNEEKEAERIAKAKVRIWKEQIAAHEALVSGIGDNLDQMIADRAAAQEQILAFEEGLARAQDKALTLEADKNAEAAEERMATWKSAAQFVASTMVSATETMVESVISGQQKIDAALLDMVSSIAASIGRAVIDNLVARAVDALITAAFASAEVAASGVVSAANIAQAEVAIGASAAEATAKSLAAYASIPFVGPALGAAQAAGLVSAIEASRALIVPAATGGEIGGGIPGRDSVNILGMPGELILDTERTRKLDRLLDSGPDNAAARGPSVQNFSYFPPDGVETFRQMRQIEKLQAKKAMVGA